VFSEAASEAKLMMMLHARRIIEKALLLFNVNQINFLSLCDYVFIYQRDVFSLVRFTFTAGGPIFAPLFLQTMIVIWRNSLASKKLYAYLRVIATSFINECDAASDENITLIECQNRLHLHQDLHRNSQLSCVYIMKIVIPKVLN
jgi:hypothetical protein